MIVGSRSAVPDDIKADICRVVRSIQFTGLAAGACAFRAGVAYLALRLLGWTPHFCVGGVLYRAGPDAMRDTMAFCGQGNAGQMVYGHFVGHVWLEMEGELIDFTCGDWPHLDPRAELLDAGLGAICWEAPPPTFVWMTRGLLDWQPEGSPEIGKLWYGLQPSNFFETLRDQIEQLGPTIVTNLVRMNLPTRVRNLAMLPAAAAPSRELPV